MENEHLRYIMHVEPEYFRPIIHEYWQEVWNYAFILTGKHDIADDMTQDVFVKAYASIQTFRGEASVKTWLLKITRNTVYNYKKSAFFRRMIPVAEVREKRSSPSAENEFFTQEFTDDIWKAMMRLSVKYREALLLEARYELSNEEMAVMLGVSVGTVKSRIHRARKKLSQFLLERGEEQ